MGVLKSFTSSCGRGQALSSSKLICKKNLDGLDDEVG